MKPDGTEQSAADEAALAEAPVAPGDVQERVRRFAVLRAAQRALDSSSPTPIDEIDPGVTRGIRERLIALTRQVEAQGSPSPAGNPALREELDRLDDALDGYGGMLLWLVERLPLSQLRATVSNETHQQRVEASALLEMCLDAEPAPSRYLRVVDFLLTLLCAAWRDGRWVAEFDPADLNDIVRRRCQRAGELDPRVESQITNRFREAAERVASLEDGFAVMQEMTAYKAAVARFYFVPSVLRCIVGYNVSARNYITERTRHGRDVDREIESDLGVFAPLRDADPRAVADAGIPAHEAPGVLAVQEAIRRRLVGAEETRAMGPAERIADSLDLSWLERDERQALLDVSQEGVHRLIRMTVVLGHLATCLPRLPQDLEALGLEVKQLDQWICALADDAQREIDTLIRDSEYEGAVRLGDTKGRFLAAVQVVARRRLGRGGRRVREADTFRRDAVNVLREYLEREKFRRAQPLFSDLLGGGWRRSAAFAAVALLVAFVGFSQLVPDDDPRAVDAMESWEARDISTLLVSGYRDHAPDASIFVGTLRNERWREMEPRLRREHAETIRDRLLERGVEEVLLFDEDRVLQAHYYQGEWRTARAWDRG